MAQELYQQIFKNAFMDTPERANPYLQTSANWEAYELGRHYRKLGLEYGTIRAGRGSNWNGTNNKHFRFNYLGKGKFAIDRLN